MAATIIVRVEDDISLNDIDPTSICRSVCVTGFQAGTKSEDLIIHFQRKKNGGGEVEKIIVSNKGTAVITFDDPEVVSSVLERKQKFEGVVLTVERYLDTMVRNSQQLESNKELSPATMASVEREGRLQNELAQMRQTLDQEIRLRARKEQELRDSERILAELLDSKEQRTQTIVEMEELDQTESAINLREKGFQNEIPQHDRQTGEAEVVRELRRRLEEEHQQKTELEERLRRLELRMEEERISHLSTEQELRSAVFAAEDALAEYQRHQLRDWIIQREEVVLSEKILGKGAWGHVSEGTFRCCKVAIKTVHELILSDYNRRLFEREMSIASRCRHPNLLQFIGATNDEGSPLFVTELLETSLRNVLHQRALNPGEIVTLALDVAKGLNYLHLSSPLPIMHRDISSANVLLWRRDDCWRAKLSDYGSANVMRQCMTVNAGAIIYSAPEAFTPRQSTKVDVYSFGVLLCEMCIREQPDPQELHNQMSRVNQDALRRLIQRCVETDPEARPTMSEVIHELEQLV